MYWTIDTGALGAKGCSAKDLRGVLEAARDFHIEDAPQAAHRRALLTMNTEKDAAKGGVSDPKQFAAHLSSKAAEADAAKKFVEERLAKVSESMNDCIDAACTLAEKMGGMVTVSLSGHYDPDHAGAVFRGVQVRVDRAKPTPED